jgi:8-oxo-dGTP pyrophosphatase MutT (NUDIX family)
MAKEYSVYFESRKIVFTSKSENYFRGSDGLYLKCKPTEDFAKLLDFFKSATYLQNLFIIGRDVKKLYKNFSQHFTVVKAAGGLVQNRDSEILIIKRNGIWDLPKGKADDDENAEQTALREVEEECGITNLSILQPIIKTYHTYTEKESPILKVTSWFSMYYAGNENLVPQDNEGISEVKWVSKAELPSYIKNTYESIKSVFVEAGLI